MPIVNRVADLQADIAAWRQDLHAHPELLYEVHRTAAFVAERLKEFGCDEVITGMGRTGVVGLIKGRKAADGQEVRTLGLRADMDALPLNEITGVPYASKNPGAMHACGHDGHTAMLLGAARYLAETRNFAGEVAIIFQPAEEGGAGAKAMIDDGLMDRFAIDQVYGMHNSPGLALGKFAIRPGAYMASMDEIRISIEGLGGHAARPHKSHRPGADRRAACGGAAVDRLAQRRSAGIRGDLDLHVPRRHRAEHHPADGALEGTVRTLKPKVRDLIEKRMNEVCDGVAALTGTKITLDYERGYPVLVNHAAQTDIAARVASEIVGDGNVDKTPPPIMGAEDFAYMLEAKPGAFIFIGNGDSAGLHHPAYNFNDEAILYGTSYWIRLVETQLAA